LILIVSPIFVDAGKFVITAGRHSKITPAAFFFVMLVILHGTLLVSILKIALKFKIIVNKPEHETLELVFHMQVRLNSINELLRRNLESSNSKHDRIHSEKE
jgi:hypothetical protein